MLFNLAEIHVFSFCDFDILACIVVEQENLKLWGLVCFSSSSICQKLVLPFRFEKQFIISLENV